MWPLPSTSSPSLRPPSPAPATLARFEAYRDAVKARARGGRPGAGRCTADGNELLRFHCAALSCSLGAGGATHLCDGAGNSSCAACGIVRDGFKFRAPGVRTMATSGRAHDDAVAVGGEEGEGGEGDAKRRAEEGEPPNAGKSRGEG